MTIQFNNIPNTQRTPGVLLEIDNSRANQYLIQNPHRALILGQKETAGTATANTLYEITYDTQADGYFGAGSILARMIKKFRENNRTTDLWALALPENGAATRASTVLSFTGTSVGAGTFYLMVGGKQVYTPITAGWSARDVCSAVKSDINGNSYLCATASTKSNQALFLLAVGSGAIGNGYDVRTNFYEGQADTTGLTYTLSAFAGGANSPDVTGAWAVIDGMQFHHIVHPYTDSTNMAAIEAELADRFGPVRDLQGHGYTAVKGTFASIAAFGLTRNCAFQTAIGAYDSPSNPESWSAAWAGVASYYLNIDPARPLQFLALRGIIPPSQKSSNRFTQQERNLLLYDGIATWIVDAGGTPRIERSITTYRVNAMGLPDPSYLDIETLFTLLEIRYQYKARMINRYIIPRFKLADDDAVVPAGSYIARPRDIKQEIIALFTELEQQGLVEEMKEFVAALQVERDQMDRSRVNVLCSPALVGQFRILAGQIQFLL